MSEVTSEERVSNKQGVARTVIYYSDSMGRPTAKRNAVRAEIVELDSRGERVSSVYLTLQGSSLVARGAPQVLDGTQYKKRVSNRLYSGLPVLDCGGKGGKPGPCPSGAGTLPAEPPGEESPEKTRGKVKRVLAAIAGLPAAAKKKAVEFVQKTYAKLEARYGKKGAVAVMAGMAVLTPVPIPGTSLIPIGIAEGVSRVAGMLRGKKPAEPPVTHQSLSLNAEDYEEALMRELAEALREWYAGNDLEPPTFSQEDLRRAIRSGLRDGLDHIPDVEE